MLFDILKKLFSEESTVKAKKVAKEENAQVKESAQEKEEKVSKASEEARETRELKESKEKKESGEKENSDRERADREKSEKDSKERAERVRVDESVAQAARAEAREIVIEAKDQALKIRTTAEEDANRIKSSAIELEKRLAIQRAEVDAKGRELEERSRTLKRAKEAIDKMNEDAEQLLKSRKEKLESLSSITKQEAREEILKQVDKELGEEKAKKIREMNEEIKRNVEEEAKQLLLEAMRYGSTDYVVEYTTSKVKLPEEDLKGRIIGKEGRNIRTLEELTGVEFDLDSNPGEILLSCFDPIRREIAKISLERLIKDGRIQPARIEEIVQKTKEELDHTIYKAGEDLCHRVGAYNIPRDLVYMLGKFKYRFSYGQNMIEHTLEETKMGVALAHELKLNVDTVRLGCLFHDIGKIVTEDEGTHIQLGVDLLNKHGVEAAVVNCVAEHHEDKPISSMESAVVSMVDHVSGARPGARGEDYESYVKRMRALEEAASQFDGVERVYAISAGREVRVFVEPTKVDDTSTEFLAREIARKIELEQTYPGVVNVTVIRETRVTETAK